MVREGPNGWSNNPKKSFKWQSSEKIWNALNAWTPEEEYIANREVEINEIKNKIEENQKAIKEVEKGLPGREEKEGMKKKMIEEFSIKKLSEFLSDEELAIIKTWREYSELIWAVKGNDEYSILIEKIYGWIKDFSDEEKLVIAKYLWNKQIIYVDMHQYECQRGLGCNVGFYYTDFPDEKYKADEVERNLGKLWIKKYVKYVWDSCYRIDNDLYKRSEKLVKERLQSDSEKEVESEFDKLREEWENLSKKLESLEERKSAVEKYGLPEKEAISLYQWSENLEWVHDEFYDKENHTLVVLHEYSDYNGSGGTEYWTVISIKRGKNMIKKSFKYRDRHDYRNDNPRYEYKEIKGVKVDWDKVEVAVLSGRSTDTYEFNIAYKEPKKSIDRKEFEESIKKIEKQLIDENTKKENYLASYNLSMRKVPWAFDYKSMDLESEIPYEEAKIIYEDIDSESGEAHVIIKKHMDASGDMWRQFWLVKYVVTPKWAEMVNEYSYWEWALDDKNVQKKIVEFSKW